MMLDDCIESVIVVPVIKNLFSGKRQIEQVGPGGLLMQNDELASVLIGKGAEQDAIYDAEDGGVRADSEGKRNDGRAGEAGIFDEYSHAVTDVLKCGLDGPAHPRLAAFFLDLLKASQPPARGETGLVWRHSPADIFFNLMLNVKPKFRVEIPFTLLAGKEKMKDGVDVKHA